MMEAPDPNGRGDESSLPRSRSSSLAILSPFVVLCGFLGGAFVSGMDWPRWFWVRIIVIFSFPIILSALAVWLWLSVREKRTVTGRILLSALWLVASILPSVLYLHIQLYGQGTKINSVPRTELREACAALIRAVEAKVPQAAQGNEATDPLGFWSCSGSDTLRGRVSLSDAELPQPVKEMHPFRVSVYEDHVDLELMHALGTGEGIVIHPDPKTIDPEEIAEKRLVDLGGGVFYWEWYGPQPTARSDWMKAWCFQR